MKHLFIVLSFAVLSAGIVAAADPPLTMWTELSPGVYTYVDENGIQHRRSLGSEGLEWEIDHVQALAEEALKSNEDAPRTAKLFSALRWLEELMDAGVMPAEQTLMAAKVLAAKSCPSVADASVDLVPYGVTWAAFADVDYNYGGCAGYPGDGAVYTICDGTPYDACPLSEDEGYVFSLSCECGTAYPEHLVASAYLHWLDTADHNYYASDVEEYPPN